jgi:hypothetical protein
MLSADQVQQRAVCLALALLISAQMGQASHAAPVRHAAPIVKKATSLPHKYGETPEATAGQLEVQIKALVANTSLQVHVTSLPGGKFAVRLFGQAADVKQAADIVALVQSVSSNLILNTLNLTTPPPATPSSLEKAALALKGYLDTRLLNTKASASVLPASNGGYILVLSGQLPENDRVHILTDAETLAAILAPQGGLRPVSQLTNTPTPASSPEDIVRIWPLMFLRGELPASAQAAQPVGDINSIGKDNAAENAATFLTGLYGADKLKVTALENRLVLKGPPTLVQHTRRLLALGLDVPSPQVRADVVIIQVNSSNTRPKSRERALAKMDEIRAGIQLVRDLMKQSRVELNVFAQHAVVKTPIDGLMRNVGFSPTPGRPLSVAEMLIFLGFTDRARNEFHDALLPGTGPLACAFQTMLTRAQAALQYKDVAPGQSPLTVQPMPGTVPPIFADWGQAPTVRAHRQNLLNLVKKIQNRVNRHGATPKVAATPLLPRLAAQYDSRLAKADAEGLTAFLQTWIACKKAYIENKPYDINEEQLPDALSSSSAATDLLLKQLMEAFRDDLQELLIQPLMEWIRDDVQQGSAQDSGIDVVGTTSVVVRNRTLAVVNGQAESYFPFTPIPKITEDNLKQARTLAQGGDTPTKNAAENVLRNPDGSVFLDANKNPVVLQNGEQAARDAGGAIVLKGDKTPQILKTNPVNLPLTALGVLSPLQALLLQGVLREDNAVTSYNRVAPGVDLAIRPFVLPDGGSARVQLNLTATVETDPLTPADYASRGRPVDRITKQSVSTEATVNAFELMELSTFGAQTTRLGDYSWRIPLIDQIPIVGQLFHGPRSRETKRQESIALITLSILPRSLDLVPFLDYPPPAPPAMHR